SCRLSSLTPRKSVDSSLCSSKSSKRCRKPRPRLFQNTTQLTRLTPRQGEFDDHQRISCSYFLIDRSTDRRRVELRAHAGPPAALVRREGPSRPLRLTAPRQVGRAYLRKAVLAYPRHLRRGHPEHGRPRGLSRSHSGASQSGGPRIDRRRRQKPRSLG